ncbi:MAG: putative virulence factor [Desulfovibrio sp.]|jgi:hypothetical protein|nr:putative virulence factor [Desulfovibrio sp.]
MQQQDQELAERCRKLAATTRDAERWLEENRDTVGSECAVLQKDMRAAARFFGKCEAAARRKMCVGVFGPSQSGKSYLISALARDAKGTLMADFGETVLDFIKEINPEGGKESTGLVTRFTTSPPSREGLPVRLRLLSQFDVARILVNTYYADCKHKEEPNWDKLPSFFAPFQERAKGRPVDANIRDQMEDMREYMSRNFAFNHTVQTLQTHYWNVATDLAPRLGLEDRLELLGVLWNRVPAFQALFVRLCGALEKLGNPAEAGCGIDAVAPRENSIIDVNLLANLEQEDTDPLTVEGAEGKRVDLPRAVVTALTAEITIHMKEKPDDFFDHTDLLDFPGYRSRMQMEDLEKELKDHAGTLATLFLRGKVAYLFERYSEEKELTSMLLCIGPGNQEVQDLTRVVDDWIRSTLGEKPEHRTASPALFFILTKMDTEFIEKAGAPNVESRWTIRLQSSLIDFFGKQHDWVANWDGKNAFNNVFLLRNPNVSSKHMFTYDANGKEAGVLEQQVAFVEKMHQAFLNSPLVSRHVADPEQIWQAALTLNDGGVQLLRQRLRPLCNPELKRGQIQVNVAERLSAITGKLQGFHHSDDSEGRRKEKEELAGKFAGPLNKMAKGNLLGAFLRRLQVSDEDIYEIGLQIRDPGAGRPVSAPPASGAGSSAKKNPRGDLKALFGDDDDTPASAAEEKPEPVRDMSTAFAEAIMDHWASRLSDFSGDPKAQKRYEFGARELNQFCHELHIQASHADLRAMMEKNLRKDAAFANMSRESIVRKQAATATDAINAFIDWLGYDPRFVGKDKRTIVFGSKTFTLFEPPAAFTGEPPIGDEEKPYERDWSRDWARAFTNAVMESYAYENDGTFDVKQNARLGDILNELKD